MTPPTGYLPDTEEHVFTVTAEDVGHDLAVFELTPEDEFTEQVVRGDLALVKVADGTQQRLAGVPFKITSKTTGESHVIVTDGNGQASTAASWNAHTKDANGGTADSGVWFGGFEPDDARQGCTTPGRRSTTFTLLFSPSTRNKFVSVRNMNWCWVWDCLSGRRLPGSASGVI